jgi:hypothetical protein
VDRQALGRGKAGGVKVVKSAAARMHLGLDDPDRTAEAPGGVDGFLRRGGDETRRHGNAIAGEQLL